MRSRTLNELDASFVEFTKQPGVLRCLRIGEDTSRAQGLNFLCPICIKTKPHGFTLLFDLPSVPPLAKPLGRHMLSAKNLSSISLSGKVQSDQCAFEGVVAQGSVHW